jgi:hypothetical protein
MTAIKAIKPCATGRLYKLKSIYLYRIQNIGAAKQLRMSKGKKSLVAALAEQRAF